MKLVIDARLATTEKELGECCLPRIVRLCRKFNFSKIETEIFIFWSSSLDMNVGEDMAMVFNL